MESFITITELSENEFSWANQLYDEVGFVHSKPGKDLVMLAKVAGKPAGLGRIVKITELEAELGGMYVMPDFRSLGIAHKLIEGLLERGKIYNRIYCLPFSHLVKLYQGYGFIASGCDDNIPEQIILKHKWCNETYAGRETRLLVRLQT
ncbi:MAG TPA: GNAT family N-acetyltransferase [Oligoflexia bacterium]|nr:GNAT family N-acetyltransferase [Oligoflexia bacterium]HMP48759.1 GNAT family N-acetyltransferase [Oligoflexia bacterium]